MGNKPINKSLRGIRDSIPAGYILGRTGNGSGPPILLPASGFATKGFVANTTIQVGGAAGGDLSGSYPNPVVAKIQTVPVKSGTPTNGQVLTYETADAEWEPETPHYIPAGGTTGQVLEKNSGTDYDVGWGAAGSGLIIGSGAPSALEAAGTIYSRSDEARDYSSQPATLTPAIVQHDSFVENTGTPGSVTIGSAPGVGNLVLAFISWGNNSSVIPTINTSKWTLGGSVAGTSSNVVGFLLYRYAQAGDTSALPAFCTAGSDYWAATIYEIGSVSGTFATDVLAFEGNYTDTIAGTVTTTNQMTTANSQLVIVAGGQYDGTTNPSISAGWTTDESQNNGSFYGGVFGGHQTVSTSGTNVQATITGTATTHVFVAMQILLGAPSTSAAWDELPLIDGTTITRSGAGVLSAAAKAMPTMQVLTSGSGATYTPATGATWIKVRMVGAGGGGGGSGLGGGGNGGNGTDTIFNSVHAAGGDGATQNSGGPAGQGGSGSANFRSAGEAGVTTGYDFNTAHDYIGGQGGSSLLGGGGTGQTSSPLPTTAYGAGGGGGDGTNQVGFFSGGGGGSAEYVELILAATTYTYTIGVGGSLGTAGSGGTNGNAGGAGVVVVEEHYT